MNTRYIALVDCNNFYVSCERVFNPKLRNKPVIVLSNNDGIAVARSEEVKGLGIPMGIPEFKIRHLIKLHNIHVYSSNYTLYADLSRRIMNILAEYSPDIEIYSIDEAFLRLDRLAIPGNDLTTFAQNMRKRVMQWTGIPVSIGIAPTKTLAKLANTVAKREKNMNGICNFINLPPKQRDEFMKTIPVRKIWGVGRQYSKKLNMMGIDSVYDFIQLNPKLARKNMTVVGYRTWLELTGTSCINLEDHIPDKKQIISSRSFGEPVTTLQQLREAVSSYTARAAEKLRSQHSVVSIMHLYVTTNYHSNGPQYSKVAAARIHPATAYTPRLIAYAHELLDNIYRDGYRYKKAGVVFSEISPANSIQYDFFAEGAKEEPNLMNAVDKINQVWGMGTVRTVAEGLKKEWSMKRTRLSRRFTTEWDELLKVG